ncbi:MAG: hypothetical protein WBL28_00255 [Methylotenera sp.]
MSIETSSKVGKGALLAVGAAALILSGCASSGKTMDKSASGEMVHCAGVNSCKGTSDCKTAENACKGQNVCKGHGFLALAAPDCSAKGGKVM